jgi:hypothetical protein
MTTGYLQLKPGTIPKHIRLALMVSASLLMAAAGLNLTGKFFDAYDNSYLSLLNSRGLGHPLFLAVPLFPLYAVASYYLLHYFISIYKRRGSVAAATAPPAEKFSWLALVSLVLGSLGLHIPIFSSLRAIATGHKARYQHRKGPSRHGVGMATVGLVTGYLFLSLWVANILRFMF